MRNTALVAALQQFNTLEFNPQFTKTVREMKSVYLHEKPHVYTQVDITDINPIVKYKPIGVHIPDEHYADFIIALKQGIKDAQLKFDIDNIYHDDMTYFMDNGVNFKLEFMFNGNTYIVYVAILTQTEDDENSKGNYAFRLEHAEKPIPYVKSGVYPDAWHEITDNKPEAIYSNNGEWDSFCVHEDYFNLFCNYTRPMQNGNIFLLEKQGLHLDTPEGMNELRFVMKLNLRKRLLYYALNLLD